MTRVLPRHVSTDSVRITSGAVGTLFTYNTGSADTQEGRTRPSDGSTSPSPGKKSERIHVRNTRRPLFFRLAGDAAVATAILLDWWNLTHDRHPGGKRCLRDAY